MSDFTTIADATIDQDSPLDEDLIEDLRENTEYLHEHELRTGSATTGVRLAICRGQEDFSATAATDDKIFSGTVTFATDGDDGEDPNFGSTPTICVSLRCDGIVGDDWTTGNGFGSVPASAIILYRDSDQFNWRVNFENSGNPDIYGSMYWIAIGPTTTGE